jgi:GNAT superfamily N-acetyltransferase
VAARAGNRIAAGALALRREGAKVSAHGAGGGTSVEQPRVAERRIRAEHSIVRPVQFELEVTADADPAAREVIAGGLREFNEAIAGPVGLQPLNVLLRDSSGAVVGGLWGRTYWRWLFVELLFVPNECRGRDLGRRLLRAAEDEAGARGCLAAWLDTFAFQAPGFYERLGYQRFGELSGLPPGYRQIFFTKRL